MRDFVVVLVLLLNSLGSCFADSHPERQHLLLTASQQANLFEADASPFQLDADFTLQIQTAISGHITLKWENETRWWREVIMADYHQVDMRNGDRLYTVRNAPFTPMRLQQLFELLGFAKNVGNLHVTKLKNRTESGVELTCLELKDSREASKRDVCTNPTTNEFVSETWEAADVRFRAQYSDYRDFRNHRYPAVLNLAINGVESVTARITSVKSAVLQPFLLVPPKGAIERRRCDGQKPPAAIESPDPTYTRDAKDRHLEGDATVAMTILTDGSVTDVHLVGSFENSMDAETLKTLQRWKFKPSMCGNEPVVADVQVIVSFRLK